MREGATKQHKNKEKIPENKFKRKILRENKERQRGI